MTSKRSERTSYTKVMKELKAAGHPRTAQAYVRGGAQGEVFGVSYASLKSLVKKVENDQELAQKLWESGNHDARVFACWVADENEVDLKLLDTWCRDVTDHGLGSELAGLAAYVDAAAMCSRKWRKAKAELKCAMGWIVLTSIATQPDRSQAEGGVTDEELRECLVRIEDRIKDSPNRVRMRMNQALIAIGCRSSMTKEALAVAKRVGIVDVDYGDRSCKTDVAYDKIKRVVAHYKAKGKKPTDGSAGMRRRHC